MKPLTLQEAKDQVAKSYGFTDWTNFHAWNTYPDFEPFRDEAALLYGDSQYNQAIEEVDKLLHRYSPLFLSVESFTGLLEELKRLKR